MTTLFADITGYTKLSREIETEDLHVILSVFYDRFDAIVKRMGGTVERHIGDCVMAVFGAPVSHGNDAERALRASMEMHRGMEEISARFHRPLSVHIGVAAGNVLFSARGQGALKEQEFTLTGDSVNLASRLADQARGGETLITELVHGALGDRILCDASTPLSVKGFEEPVRAYLFKAFSDRVVERPIIGRARELGEFARAIAECRAAGRGETLAIVGEAGLGKSRLIEEFDRMARAQGFETHKALVLDFGLGETQGPMRTFINGLSNGGQALEDMLARDSLDERAVMFLTEMRGAPVSQQAALVLDAMSDEARKEGRRDAVRRLLLGRAAERPILLIVEDVHWADGQVMEHAALIASVTAEAPVLFAMTVRPEGDPLDTVWRAGAGQATLRRMEVAPLTAADALELARHSMRGPTDEIVQACIERAEGNPLFLDQLLRHAREQGFESVPSTIQSLVQARLDRLPDSDRTALEAAAVLGQRFTSQAVSAVAGVEAFDETGLVEASLIRPIAQDWLFAHALIRDAVLRTVLRDDLRAMHRRAASWFKGDDRALYAEHLAAAADAGAAAAYLEAAGEARSRHQKETALSLADRGLALDGDAATQGALLRLKGAMLRDLGRGEEAIAAFEAALGLSAQPVERCRAQIGIVAAMRIMDRIDDALALLDEVEKVAEAADLAPELSEIHYFRGSLYFPRGNLDGCLREHGKSLECAERCALPERRALALSGLGDAHYARGRMFTAHTVIKQCLELCDEHGLGAVEAANRFMLATVMIYMNKTEGALENALASANLASQVGHARAEIVSRLTASWVLASMNETAEARAEVRRGLDAAERLGARRFEPFLEETLARVQLAEGDRAGASATAEGALAKIRELGAMSFIGPWVLSTVARAAENPARRAEALAEGEALLAKGCVGHNYFRFYRYAIDACLGAGEWSEARRYAQGLADYTAEEPTPWSDYFIARAHALVDAAEGKDARDRLLALRADAESARLNASIPKIDAALGSLGERSATVQA